MESPQASENTPDASGMKILFTSLWMISVVIAGYIGYGYGQGQTPDKKVLTPTPTIQANPTVIDYTVPGNATTVSPAMVDTKACAKTGFAQKWEYLTAYVIKENDTLQSIATEQLKDETRSNEILQINGVNPLVIGSTLYLPPASIAKSSGNIKQVYGKLVEKNSTSWQLNFSNDPKGQGILFPSFWFESVPNNDSYKIGDCLKIFFDDGFKVYSVDKQ